MTSFHILSFSSVYFNKKDNIYFKPEVDLISKLHKAISLILAMTVMFSLCLNVYAVDTDTPVEDDIISEYVNINTTNSSITISGVSAKCYAQLKAQSSVSLSIVMTLQKSTSSGYENVKTWSASKTGTSISLSESKVINIFSSYRLKVTFTAGGETKTVYTYP